MILNVRTKNDLRDLLRNRASGNWNVGVAMEPQITEVRVFNWDCSQVLKGEYDHNRSARDADNDLIIGIANCRIENFNFHERWFHIFQMASVAYTPPISVQKVNDRAIGILRDANFSDMSQNEIDVFYKRLIAEIRLRGLKKIVFKAGGYPIPDFFRQWCQDHEVTIEILSEEVLNHNYPIENDIFWEGDLFLDNQNLNNRD